MPFLKKKNWETEKIEEESGKNNTQKDKSWMKKEGELVVDVYETENSIVIQAPLGGVKKEDLEITAEKDMVVIKGKRERPKEEDIKQFYTKECFFGSFRREVIIPEETDPSNIKASIEDGIATIEIPKIEKEKKRKVEL